MDTSTSPIDWRTVLRAQGRNLTWLAEQTETPRRTVYAYNNGQIKNPPPEWLALVAKLLGIEVAA